MHVRNGTVFFATLLLGLTGAVSVVARCAWEDLAAKQASAALADEESGRLMAEGKGIFVEKCAKCHNERGDKELGSGKPLNERGLAPDALARIVSGRLSKGSDKERRAVTAYIASLMKDPAKAETKP